LKKRKKGETSGHLVLQDDEKTMTVFRHFAPSVKSNKRYFAHGNFSMTSSIGPSFYKFPSRTCVQGYFVDVVCVFIFKKKKKTSVGYDALTPFIRQQIKQVPPLYRKISDEKREKKRKAAPFLFVRVSTMQMGASYNAITRQC
jgi:hypothetical protein